MMSLFRKKSSLAFFFSSLALAPAISNAQDYATYGLYPQGTARVSAVGGAFTAVSDDLNGVFYNPAGLAFLESGVSAGGDSNTVDNKEADLNGDGERDGLPYSYFGHALSFRLDQFAFGLGYSAPYAVDLTFSTPNGGFTETRELELGITSLDIAIAYRLNPKWALGMTMRGLTLEERYARFSTDSSITPIDLSTTKSVNNIATFGVSYRHNEKWGLGLTYKQRVRIEVNSEINDQTDGVNWFRSAVLPTKVTFGGFYKPHPRVLLVGDLDWIDGISNAVYVGSELIPQFSKVTVDPSGAWVAHGGIEWQPVEHQFIDVYLRGGFYVEPPRIVGNTARTHKTFGIALRPAFLLIEGTVDTAEDFLNYTLGVGLSFKMF